MYYRNAAILISLEMLNSILIQTRVGSTSLVDDFSRVIQDCSRSNVSLWRDGNQSDVVLFLN
jgi:hypothetical protein